MDDQLVTAPQVTAPPVTLSKPDRELLELMASGLPTGSVTYYPGRWSDTNAELRTRYKFERWQPASHGMKLYVRVTAPVDRLHAAGLVDFPTSTKPCPVSVTPAGHAWLAEYRRAQALKTRVKMTAAQVHLVRHFAGLPTGPKVALRQSTYDGVEARGWVERCDQWPYRRTTTAGLAALASFEGWA